MFWLSATASTTTNFEKQAVGFEYYFVHLPWVALKMFFLSQDDIFRNQVLPERLTFKASLSTMLAVKTQRKIDNRRHIINLQYHFRK